MRWTWLAGVVLLAGCGDKPVGLSPGDKLLLPASAVVWPKKTDMLNYWSFKSPPASWDGLRAKGALLGDGSTVQVLDVEPDSLRVRVLEDASPQRTKAMLGDSAGKVGFMSPQAKAVKLAN